jgi:hypothetical protein
LQFEFRNKLDQLSARGIEGLSTLLVGGGLSLSMFSLAAVGPGLDIVPVLCPLLVRGERAAAGDADLPRQSGVSAYLLHAAIGVATLLQDL